MPLRHVFRTRVFERPVLPSLFLLEPMPSETTEVTPANYIGTKNHFETYEIPNCSGSWNESSPDAHNTYVRTNDQRLSNKVKPLIRFIKAWKYFQNVPISSFYLELRIAKYSSEEVSIYYAIDVKRIFSHLNSVNLAKIRDPMGVSGLIAPCRSEAEMLTAKSKLSTALSRANQGAHCRRSWRHCRSVRLVEQALCL